MVIAESDSGVPRIGYASGCLGPVQRLGQELPDAPALLGLVGELAQHDGPLAIEIRARRPRCRQTAERAQRRRHVVGHDDRVDGRLLARRGGAHLATERLDLAPRVGALARAEDQVLVQVRCATRSPVARPHTDREPHRDDGPRAIEGGDS